MSVKIEVQSSRKIKGLDAQVERVLSVIPAEHLRGLQKIVFVDTITEPRLSADLRSALPALYHPRLGGQPAWAEIATRVLLPEDKLSRRILARMALKPNLAQVLLSVVAQHYHLTLAKGVKKGQLERACREYAEKYFERWREREGGLRFKLTKPIRPYLDRLAKKLSRRYREEVQKKRAG
jgi:hypothetical protein